MIKTQPYTWNNFFSSAQMSTEPIVFVHSHHLFDLCLIYIFILLITCHPVPLHGTASGGWGGVFPQTIIRLLHCCQMEREIPSRGNFRGKIPHCPHLSLQNTLWDGKWKIIRQHCVIFLALFPVKRRTLKILMNTFSSVDLGKQFLGFSCCCKIFFLIKENTLENNNLTLCVLTLFSLSVSHFPELCRSCLVPCLVQALDDPTQTNRFIHRTRTPLNLN